MQQLNSKQNNQYSETFLNSNVNPDHLISNRNIEFSQQPTEMNSLKQTTDLIHSKNQETINALKAHQDNMI